MVLEKVSEYCKIPVTHPSADKYDSPYVWTFYHSFYFVFTVVSTVGYGNISPNSTFGRMFMIFYAIIGLPLNAIMFANLGEIFGRTVSKVNKNCIGIFHYFFLFLVRQTLLTLQGLQVASE